MKISKVNHTKAAVKASGKKTGGILYQDPGSELNLEKHFLRVNHNAQVLYAVFTSPNMKTETDEEIAQKKKDADTIKAAGLDSAIFSKNDQKQKLVNPSDVIIKKLSGWKPLAASSEEIDRICELCLRKSLKPYKETVARILKNFGNKPALEKEAKNIETFRDAVEKDFRKEDKAKLIIRSIEDQNMLVQPEAGDSGETMLHLSRTVHNEEKNTSYKEDEKEGLDDFLLNYADLDEEKRMDYLRSLRRLIDLYFNPVLDADGMALPELSPAVNKGAFDPWEAHKKAKENNADFVTAPRGYFKTDKEIADQYQQLPGKKHTRDSVKAKKDADELRALIRKKNMQSWHYAKKIVESAEYKELFFPSEKENNFWIHHIENSVERIYKPLNSKKEFKMRVGYLSEKVWKDCLNLISVKYISVGKAVYNFAMEDLGRADGDVNLGRIADAAKNGISSFDYERIKAGETLQREVSVAVAFAANNLARATVDFGKAEEGEESAAQEKNRRPRNMEDFLLWKEPDLSAYRKDSAEGGTLKQILQFFGGASNWDDMLFRDAEGKIDDAKILGDFQKAIYAMRNQTFHFTTLKSGEDKWDKELFGKMFAIDAGRALTAEKDKFYSNNLPMFYQEKDLRKMLDILYSSYAERKSQIPAFNKVFVRRSFPQQVESEFHWSPKYAESDAKDKWYSAVYYLLKEVYYQCFLSDPKAADLFWDAVDSIEKGAENERAAGDFKRRCQDLKKDGFDVSSACQAIMTEYNAQNAGQRKVKSARAEAKDPAIFRHYKLLLLQVLRTSFAKYVTGREDFAFLGKNLSNAGELPAAEDFVSDWKSAMYAQLIDEVKAKPGLQKWYITARLLDNKTLNMLVGTLRSTIQYLDDIQRRAESTHASTAYRFSKDQKREIKRAIEIIDLCIKNGSSFSHEFTDYFVNENAYADYLSHYLDFGGTDAAALAAFCNGGAKYGIYYDGQHPILNRNIILSKLYGPEKILDGTIDKVTAADLDKYYEQSGDIASYKLNGAVSSEGDQKKVLSFARLKNHVEFRDVLEFSEMINELQGQLVNWSFMRERDLMYFQLGFHYTCLQNKADKPEAYRTIAKPEGGKLSGAILYQIAAMYIGGLGIYAPDKDGGLIELSRDISAGVKIPAFCKYSKALYPDRPSDSIYNAGLEVFENVKEHDNVVKDRDAIEHFHYYTGNAGSILDMYSEVFDRFFTYDMKYQKNVLNMLENILLRHFLKAIPELGTGKKTYGTEEKDRAQIRITKLTADTFTFNYTDTTGTARSLTTSARDKDYLLNVARILYFPDKAAASHTDIEIEEDSVKDKKKSGTGDDFGGSNGGFNGKSGKGGKGKSGGRRGDRDRDREPIEYHDPDGDTPNNPFAAAFAKAGIKVD